MFSLKCKFPLIKNINIHISDINLYQFAKRQFKNYMISESSNENKNFVTIYANDFDDLNFEDTVLGRTLEFKDNKLKLIKNSRIQNLTYEYDFNEKLILSIDFKKRSLYYLKQILNSQYGMNHSLFYQTILYPIFSLYTIKGNYSLIHGSLIKIKDNYIVLAGLDGVGKSSISNELALLGHKILADNFVLYNGDKFIGLNIPIRLDLDNDTKENVIFENNNLKEVLFNYTEDIEVTVDKVYFLSIAKILKIKQINNDTASLNWNLINNGANEILGANMYNIPFLYQNLLKNNIVKSEHNTYMFSIPKDQIKEATKELLCQLSI